MRGYFKAKASYKKLKDEESYKILSPKKHKKLIDGEIVYLETNPRLIEKDFSEHLTEKKADDIKSDDKKSDDKKEIDNGDK